jgi:hypothetical protein
MRTVSVLPPWSSGCCIQVRFFAIKRRDLNMIIKQGVIRKDPHSVPIVNSVRAVATHGTRLRKNHHDDDDDFDL